MTIATPVPLIDEDQRLQDLLRDEEIVPYDETDDGADHLTHIVNQANNSHIWQPGMKAQDIVNIARLLGKHVVALCGYKWVPQRNPDKYPVCQACMDIAGNIMREDG